MKATVHIIGAISSPQRKAANDNPAVFLELVEAWLDLMLAEYGDGEEIRRHIEHIRLMQRVRDEILDRQLKPTEAIRIGYRLVFLIDQFPAPDYCR